jgi:hypothetical protein
MVPSSDLEREGFSIEGCNKRVATGGYSSVLHSPVRNPNGALTLLTVSFLILSDSSLIITLSFDSTESGLLTEPINIS